jgi:hypothetical protein
MPGGCDVGSEEAELTSHTCRWEAEGHGVRPIPFEGHVGPQDALTDMAAVIGMVLDGM